MIQSDALARPLRRHRDLGCRRPLSPPTEPPASPPSYGSRRCCRLTCTGSCSACLPCTPGTEGSHPRSLPASIPSPSECLRYIVGQIALFAISQDRKVRPRTPHPLWSGNHAELRRCPAQPRQVIRESQSVGTTVTAAADKEAVGSAPPCLRRPGSRGSSGPRGPR